MLSEYNYRDIMNYTILMIVKILGLSYKSKYCYNKFNQINILFQNLANRSMKSPTEKYID